MGYENLANSENPLRISGLPNFLLCPMKQYLLSEGLLSDQGGPAAQTGSLFHAYAYHWHHCGSVREAVKSQEATWQATWPRADQERAEALLKGYAQDPVNQEAKVVCAECQVCLVLPCHDLDVTRQPVVLRGTLDQVRLHPDGTLRVWDLKTGRKTSQELQANHAAQLAGYTLAARQSLDPAIIPGGYIRVEGYETGRGNVHVDAGLSIQHCEAILSTVVLRVAMYRRGEIDVVPGEHCGGTCPARSVTRCVDLFHGNVPATQNSRVPLDVTFQFP